MIILVLFSRFCGKPISSTNTGTLLVIPSTLLLTVRDPESSEGYAERLTGGVNVILA